MKRIYLYFILLAFTFLLCVNNKANGQNNKKIVSLSIKPFEATILNSDYSMAYSVLTILTNNKLTIVFKSGLVGEKDSVIFSKSLQPSDTLQQINNINFYSLKEYYSNECVSDGSQVTVTLTKNEIKKIIHLSNFYQEDVGKIIYLINSFCC